MAHTILLLQPGKPESRTYSDFERSVNFVLYAYIFNIAE